MRNVMTPKMQAVDKAISSYEEIKTACTRPDKSINGETLDIYNELVDWGFVERYPIFDPNNKWLYVMVIAMHLSKSIKAVSTTDSYCATDKAAKWQIIKSALEKTTKTKKKE